MDRNGEGLLRPEYFTVLMAVWGATLGKVLRQRHQSTPRRRKRSIRHAGYKLGAGEPLSVDGY